MALAFTAAESAQTYGVLRGATVITPAVADEAVEVELPTWTRIFTVETLGTDIKVHVRGTDGAAIGTIFTDVASGAGPRVYSITDGRSRAGDPATGVGPKIYVASDPAGVLFVVEAQSNEMNP